MSQTEEGLSGGQQDKGSPASSSYLRSYPPLVLFVLAVLIAVLVLPSSLNLPNSNPSTVLEYAPVPPEDDTPPQSEGSISQLGLGESSGLTTGQGGQGPGGGGKTGGEKPISKKCVAKPARQTEDPNSPTCVPFFDGDNGGKTWQGVTEKEVTVVLYHSAFISDENEREGGETSAGEYTPVNVYCDLDQPVSEQRSCQDRNVKGKELSVVTAARAYSRYFNERFQTYGRRVHIYIFWTSASTATGRRSEAAGIWERLKPFAIMDRATFGGFNDVFAEAAGKRNISTFGSFGSLENEYFRLQAPKVWSFWPDVEHWADQYVTYVCTKVVPFPVSHAGPGIEPGQPRRLALMYTEDHSFPGLQVFANLVERGVKDCGGNIVEKVSFPFSGANIDNRCATESETPNCDYGIQNVALMKKAEATTVLWAGGMESRTTQAARSADYDPEWVVAGDRVIDDLLNGRAQQQDVWRHAWVMSNHLREIRFEESPARQAFREAEPRGRQIQEYWATTLYREFFGLFKAIQVAGPYLSPETVDQGQHSIARQSSEDPRTAACFYDPGDYSCVKDAHEAWWDPDAPDPNKEPNVKGCWRMVRDGKRYLAGTWEKADEVQQNRADACNGIKGASYNYPA